MSRFALPENKVHRKFNFIAVILLLTVLVSQCFPQSNSESSKDAALNSKRYAELTASIFDFVYRNYVDEVDPSILYKGALKGMLEAFEDPYTTYLDTSNFRDLSDTTEGSFGGVGLSISKPLVSTPEKPAYVEVASPIEDTPGFKAGIHAGDFIISINGVDTSTITMDEVLDVLRGRVGETVDLVIRRGASMEFPVTLERAIIEVPTVKFGTIKSSSSVTKKPLGYLKIIEFTPLTAERVQDAFDSFDTEGISGLIIDLRNNPGGLISSVVDVANKFIDSGTIVSTKSRLSFENSVYTAVPSKTTFKGDLPIVVLINKGSASASEILSGALKDYHLAYLVGERTYGKGSVQQVLPLSSTDGIKITMARYYTPSDVNIDKIGIPPDREVSFPKLSEEGEKQFTELAKSNEIKEYVENHAEMNEKDIADFGLVLQKKYSDIGDKMLRKLIRNEVYRTKGSLLYDLDYDIQLCEAIKILDTENFSSLMKMTKTLKELQEEALLTENVEVASGKN